MTCLNHRDSAVFLYETRNARDSFKRVAHRSDAYDTIISYVLHASFIRLTHRIHTRDMSYSCV